MKKSLSTLHNHGLILGGARSGKSAYAEKCAENTKCSVTYIATAEAFDDEMKDRISKHRKQRVSAWETVEAPVELSKSVMQVHAEDVIVIDCLTLWLSNLMHAERDIDRETALFLQAVATRQAPVFCVSNELGMGLVPETALGRRFRDAQGRLNQRVAAAFDTVVFVAAGLPLCLKGQMPE